MRDASNPTESIVISSPGSVVIGGRVYNNITQQAIADNLAALVNGESPLALGAGIISRDMLHHQGRASIDGSVRPMIEALNAKVDRNINSAAKIITRVDNKAEAGLVQSHDNSITIEHTKAGMSHTQEVAPKAFDIVEQELMKHRDLFNNIHQATEQSQSNQANLAAGLCNMQSHQEQLLKQQNDSAARTELEQRETAGRYANLEHSFNNLVHSQQAGQAGVESKVTSIVNTQAMINDQLKALTDHSRKLEVERAEQK